MRLSVWTSVLVVKACRFLHNQRGVPALGRYDRRLLPVALLLNCHVHRVELDLRSQTCRLAVTTSVMHHEVLIRLTLQI